MFKHILQITPIINSNPVIMPQQKNPDKNILILVLLKLYTIIRAIPAMQQVIKEVGG